MTYFERLTGMEIPVLFSDVVITSWNEPRPPGTGINSKEWLVLRELVLAVYGAVCMKCDSEERPQVDHIIPRHTHPELTLDFDNLQVLCKDCNEEKGILAVDYRAAHKKPLVIKDK